MKTISVPSPEALENKIPAIVLGMDSSTSLGVVRCLAEARIPIIGVDSKPDRYPLKSRFVRRLVLSGNFEEALLDKWQTYLELERLGIPTPRTFCPKNKRELDSLLRSGRFREGRWIVKPRSWLPEHRSGQTFGNRKAILPRTETQLREICLMNFKQSGSFPMLQQIAASRASKKILVNLFIDKEGRVIRAISHRKIRSYAPGFGSGSSYETQHHPQLIERAARFYTGIGFYGFGAAEFIYDDNVGDYLLLEVNPRFTLSIMLQRAAGFDPALLFYQSALGIRLQPRFGFREGLRLVQGVDFISIWQQHDRNGIIGPLADLFKNLPSTCAFESFSLSDPRPFLAYLRSGAAKLKDALVAS